MQSRIPLSVPFIEGNEWTYVKECLDTGWVSSVGAYVTQFEKMVAEYTGSSYGVAAVNGTAALHIALQLAGVLPGDYVILPNITFVASANSIVYTGAEPLFMDIEPHTWQIDLDLLEKFLENECYCRNNTCFLKSKNNARISAIMPVHILGNMCNMERLMDIATQYGLTVVEDSTEALGTYFKGKHAGSFGKLGCFSFNGNKIITTGGGGTIVTDDEILAKRAKHLTTQAKSDSFEYIHDDIGYNYRLVNILAAVGVGQLEVLSKFIKRKKAIFARYQEGFADLTGLVFQKFEPDVDPNCWLVTIRTDRQKELIQALTASNIECRPFWRPMSLLPMFRKNLYFHDNNNSIKIYSDCLSIPCSVSLTIEEQNRVINEIRNCYV